MISNWLPEGTLTEILAAKVSAESARQVPGVVRLQPSVLGLIKKFSQDLWMQVTGEELTDTCGVEVDLDTTGVRITLSLVTAGDSRTVDVVALVQLAVLAAVRHALDRDDVHVEVFVTDVDLTSLYGGSSVTSRPSR